MVSLVSLHNYVSSIFDALSMLCTLLWLRSTVEQTIPVLDLHQGYSAS